MESSCLRFVVRTASLLAGGMGGSFNVGELAWKEKRKPELFRRLRHDIARSEEAVP